MTDILAVKTKIIEVDRDQKKNIPIEVSFPYKNNRYPAIDAQIKQIIAIV
jgi:hypothetical protein